MLTLNHIGPIADLAKELPYEELNGMTVRVQSYEP